MREDYWKTHFYTLQRDAINAVMGIERMLLEFGLPIVLIEWPFISVKPGDEEFRRLRRISWDERRMLIGMALEWGTAFIRQRSMAFIQLRSGDDLLIRLSCEIGNALWDVCPCPSYPLEFLEFLSDLGGLRKEVYSPIDDEARISPEQAREIIQAMVCLALRRKKPWGVIRSRIQFEL